MNIADQANLLKSSCLVLKDIPAELIEQRIVELRYNPDQPRDPKGSDTGGQWASEEITIPVKDVSSTGRSVIPKLPNGVRTKSSELEKLTGHGFRWMGRDEFRKFANGDLRYGGEAENEHERGVMFANTPGDFFYGGGKKRIYLIEVNVQGTGGGLDAPKDSVGLKNLVGAWVYNPETKTLENLIK